MRVLLIKMSSLGDVVHALAGVTDAIRANPSIQFDWVVEEAYQDIPKWHPAINRVIASPLRRWRKSPVRTIRSGEWNAFRQELCRENYDLVLDAQGLLKSAFVGLQANGPLAGRNGGTAREPAASLLYKRRLKVDLTLSEVEQLRHLFALALGYEKPSTPADFGIDRKQFNSPVPGRYVVFLHGAAWETKLWPEQNWIRVGQEIRRAGFSVLLPWGNESEHQRAQQIAAEIQGQVLDQLTIPKLSEILAGAEFVVGLDTGLTHIAVALGVPTVTLYGPSVPVYDSVAGGRLVNVCSTESKVVDTTRSTTIDPQQVINAVRPWLRQQHATPL